MESVLDEVLICCCCCFLLFFVCTCVCLPGAYEHKTDHIRLVEKKLTHSDPREWQTGLQTLYALLHDFPSQCKWEEHFKTVFLRLMVILDTPESTQRVLVLRIVREILKSDGHYVKDYAEMTAMKVLKCYAHQDALVSGCAGRSSEWVCRTL